MNYENWYETGKRDDLKTGDTLLFSGRGPASLAIQIGTLCKWSHIGLVIRDDLDIIMSWESTMLVKQPSLDSGIIESGVMLLDLGRRIREYDGEVAVRHLQAPLTVTETAIMMDMRHEFHKVAYEQKIIQLIRSAYDGPFGANVEDLSSLFCSELWAAFYKRIGLLPIKKPSNEYTPEDGSRKNLNHILGPIDYLKKEAA